MKKLIAITAFTLMCGSAFAQNTGARANAQTDINKPGMNTMENGSMDKGSMNNSTTGMSNDSMSKDNPKKELSKHGAPFRRQQGNEEVNRALPELRFEKPRCHLGGAAISI